MRLRLGIEAQWVRVRERGTMRPGQNDSGLGMGARRDGGTMGQGNNGTGAHWDRGIMGHGCNGTGVYREGPSKSSWLRHQS